MKIGRNKINCSILQCIFLTVIIGLNNYRNMPDIPTTRNSYQFQPCPTDFYLRPFNMPIKTPSYEIFQPTYDMAGIFQTTPTFGSAQSFIYRLQQRFNWLDTITTEENLEHTSSQQTHNNIEKARLAYTEIMKYHVSGVVYGSQEKSIYEQLNVSRAKIVPLNFTKRLGGLDWPYLGDTMTGWERLDNVRSLLVDVIKSDIRGDYIETGVWRGGSSMFARSVLYAYGQEKERASYVCDSFAGLPPGERGLAARDKGWDNTKYLEVSPRLVAENFRSFSLMDPQVIFVKGFFNETMPQLATKAIQFSVMRLDGDMYESTVDVLYHLYDKLSIGGYIIMDDWYGFPSKIACEDFFAVHNISPKIIQIDKLAAYWKKTEEIDLQYWRYQQNKFTDKK